MRIPASDDVLIREIDGDSELLEAQRFHGRCYLEAGYVSHLSPGGVIEDEWVESSKYFVAVHAEREEIVGVCRFVLNSDAGFPLLQEFDLSPEWAGRFTGSALDNCYEVSSLAVGGGLQHTLVSGLFYRQTVRYSTAHPESAHLLAAMDDRLLRLLRRWMHLPFHQIGEARDYMGSKTVPVYGYMPELIASVADHDSEEADYLMDGRSYDEIGELVLDLRGSASALMPTGGHVGSA